MIAKGTVELSVTFVVVSSIVNGLPSVADVTLGVNVYVEFNDNVPDSVEAKVTPAEPKVPLKLAVDAARAGLAV